MRVVAIVQARMGSDRLPGKIIRKLPFNEKGEYLINIILSQLNNVDIIDEVVLATSVNKENDILNNILTPDTEIFRGDENNVLERFYEASKQYNADIILRFTGDNPIIATEYISEIIDQMKSNNIDYIKTVGLPLGTNLEAFTYKSLEKAYREADLDKDKEHVTPYIIRNDFFNKKIINYSFPELINKLRLTIDYPSDFAMMNLLFCNFENIPTIREVVKFVSNNSWILDVNSSNKQLS